MSIPAALDRVSRPALLTRFDAARAVTRRLFGLIREDAYYSRPIALRNPIVFYEGHISAFAVNTLLKKALGAPGIDDELERIFARGIDPEDEAAVGTAAAWPTRARVVQYMEEADRRLRQAILQADIDRPGDPLLDRAEAVHAVIEHEEMHQETLHYIWHRLPLAQKQRPAGYALEIDGHLPPAEMVEIAPGRATLGVGREDVAFAWDNEVPPIAVDVDRFAIARHDVTNAEFLEFVDAGGYRDARWWSAEAWSWRCREAVEHPLFWERDGEGWSWRAMFERVPLPASWPVYVSHAEADAFARWRGLRLPTEAEYHRAAFGTPAGDERAFPWGDALPGAQHGNFGNQRFDPVPVGSAPAGASAWGVHDLVGNGWEWTSTVFRPFPGFEARASYPEYSADFFDDRHVVMKGASPATPAASIRRSFRNWFRPHYPYVYATFRCVRA